MPAPGLRAPFVHVKVEDSTSREDTDQEEGGRGGGDAEEATSGEGDREGEEVKEEEAGEEDEEADHRDLRAHESGASLEGGSAVVRPRSLTPGSRSNPGAPRARLLAPRRVADNVVHDKDVPQQQHKAGSVLELVMRGGGDRAGTSQYKGVCRDKATSKWKATCEGNYLSVHTTEEAAARAYSNFIKHGGVPDPAGQGKSGTSQFKGVSWHKQSKKWAADCKGTRLGYHTTEGDAARAYSKFLEDGIDIVKHRAASTSQFTGVHWDKSMNKWKVTFKHKYLGYHNKEEDAVRAYNVEAERLGIALNVIPSAGAADAGVGGGAGPKRAASKTAAALAAKKKPKRAAPRTPAAPAPSKEMKLYDPSEVSSSAADASGVTSVP